MKPMSSNITDMLNKLLVNELTAVDQYFVHWAIFNHWGLKELANKLSTELEEEREHAQKLIERLLFLEGSPNINGRAALKVGKTLPEMLTNDLDLEVQVIQDLKDSIKVSESAGDFVTRELLLELLRDSETGHAYWLEQQLSLIQRIGLQNYKQSMMGLA